MPRGPHGRSRFKRYVERHHTLLKRSIDEGFVGVVQLPLYFPGPVSIGYRVRGEIGCLDNLVIAVDFTLEVVDESGVDDVIEMTDYSFNVFVRGHGNVIRYDNLHPDFLHEGHADPHHRHEFDWKTGDEVPGSPRWLGKGAQPSLADVIAEAREWYWQHREELPEAVSVGAVGVRR